MILSSTEFFVIEDVFGTELVLLASEGLRYDAKMCISSMSFQTRRDGHARCTAGCFLTPTTFVDCQQSKQQCCYNDMHAYNRCQL